MFVTSNQQTYSIEFEVEAGHFRTVVLGKEVVVVARIAVVDVVLVHVVAVVQA